MKNQADIAAIAHKYNATECVKIRSHIFQLKGKNKNYLVKEISKTHTQCAGAFELLTTRVVDEARLIHRPLELLENHEKYFWIEEELHGSKDYAAIRARLSGIYAALARFHMQNRFTGAVSCMYLDGNYFDSIEKMLSYEFEALENDWDDKSQVDLCRRHIMRLNEGFAAVIHGDVHPGNILLQKERAVLIDSEWCSGSLNLFDFEHVDLFGIGREYPEKITAEALACFQSYFSTLGISRARGCGFIISLGVLSLMRRNVYDKFKEDERHLEQIPALLKKVISFEG